MTRAEPSLLDKRRAEAAHWRVRLEGDPALERSNEYAQWLADPENRAMADRARASWDLVGEFSASPEMIAVRQEALADARRASRSKGVVTGARRRWIVGAMGAAAIAAGVVFVAPMVFPQVYKTGVGERRIVMLRDGSRLSLDADSEVRVRLLTDARKLDLLHGQARFEVAHDASRPFSVHARDRVVLATGTDFNVNLLGKSLLVTLVEGRVLVHGEDAAVTSTALKAGEQMVIAPGAKPIVTDANLKGVTAWERGQLVFDDEPLTLAVLRVNRYAPEEIVVGHGVSGVRVSGAFDAGDTPAFLNAMSDYFNLDAVERDGKIILQPRA